MTNHYTSRQVADRLGVNTSRVRQIAARLNIGTKHGRDWVFTEQDIEKLQQRNQQPGRPRKEGMER